MGARLSRFTKPDADTICALANLTDDERLVFELLVGGMIQKQIYGDCRYAMSESKVGRLKRSVDRKIERLIELGLIAG